MSETSHTDARRLVDALGTEHRCAGDDVRILSLVPSITELLIDLGLGSRLVGRTHYCVHPAERVAEIPSVGGTKKIKLDRARALEPTHVIVNVDENTKDMADALATFVPSLVVTHPLGPEDNPPLYRLMGGLFGREAEAEALCAAFAAALDRLHELTARLPERVVAYMIWKDPWMTVGRDTYVSRFLALARLRTWPEIAVPRYPEIAFTPEALDRLDAILFADEPFAFDAPHVEAFAAEHPGARPALRLIDGSMTQWYGSRAVRGLDYLADFAASLDTARPARGSA